MDHIEVAFAEVNELYTPPEPIKADSEPPLPTTDRIKIDEDWYFWAKTNGLMQLQLPRQKKTIDLFEWYQEVQTVNEASFLKYVKRVRAVLDPANYKKTGIDLDLAVDANAKFEEKVKIILDKPPKYSPFPGVAPVPSGSWSAWSVCFDASSFLLLQAVHSSGSSLHGLFPGNGNIQVLEASLTRRSEA